MMGGLVAGGTSDPHFVWNAGVVGQILVLSLCLS